VKIGKQTWQFDNEIYLTSTGTAGGPLEKAGPLGSTIDKTFDNLYCGEKTWELAERKLMREAVDICLKNINKKPKDMDLFLAGDLLNQTVTSNYVAAENQIPYIGLFGACSTSMESLALAAHFVDSGAVNYALTAVSSHNSTAERQFRNPTEYGGPKQGTTQSTVTGAGASIVSRDPSSIRITGATIGSVQDWGIANASDMGSAMAPAAADTIEQHLKDTGRKVTDYDLIVTGDLASIGSPIVRELMWERGYDISQVHQDCGLMIYSPDQSIFAGGSGCACSAVVTYSYLTQLLKKKELKRIFVVATGALFNPTMIQQKESIPCIAHGVVLEAAEEVTR
jgi:stage V sporulation protein AD